MRAVNQERANRIPAQGLRYTRQALTRIPLAIDPTGVTFGGMSQQPPASPEPPGRDELPSWAGAPGFTPYQDVGMPHAPMPGAPPYPPDIEPPPPQVGRPPTGASLGRAFLAAGVWAMIALGLVLLVDGAPAAADLGRFVLALIAPTVLTAPAIRVVARTRAWSFWMLLLVAAPFFWVLRAVQSFLIG